MRKRPNDSLTVAGTIHNHSELPYHYRVEELKTGIL
jgi:hypothetical protein